MTVPHSAFRTPRLHSAKAKALALAYLNGNRKVRGMKPLKRVARGWWRLYCDQWIEVAKEHCSGLGTDARLKPEGF
jgi:hypothetical protein